MKNTAPAGVRAVDMGPLRELRTKRPRHTDLRTRKRPRHTDLRTRKRPRHVDLLRMKKTAPAGVRAVDMGPLRELRTKKTAPRGSIKDEKDRASWSESGRYGSS